MQEKSAFYLDAGAIEVWLCGADGALRFFSGPGQRIECSALAPDFPESI